MAKRRPARSNGPRSKSSPSSRRVRPGAGSHFPPPRTSRPHGGASGQQRGSRPRDERRPGNAEPGKPERLQKVLAHAGLGSRRACEELILQGRVAVDGQVVRQLGTRVDTAIARVTVDGEPICLETTVYFAVNKPKGYVSTNSDPAGRPRVVDLLPEIPERVYTVGRLDEDSTGLLILTNDGELANRLAHPRYGVEKIYRALVAGLPGPEMIAKLTEGIWLSDGKVRAKRARIIGRQGQATQLELVLAEGKKREVRRMLAKLGHKVMALTRIAMGPVSLRGLPLGECRPLSRHEVDLLRKVASGIAVSAPRSVEGEFSDDRPMAHTHASIRPGRRNAGPSPSRKGPVRRGTERRTPENIARPGATPGHSQRRNAPASMHAPRADRSGYGKKRTIGTAVVPPARAGGVERPTIVALPAEEPSPARRIIGMEPEPPTGRHQGARRRSMPKRPPTRKPRLRLRRPPDQKQSRTSPGSVDEKGTGDA